MSSLRGIRIVLPECPLKIVKQELCIYVVICTDICTFKKHYLFCPVNLILKMVDTGIGGIP